MIIETFSDLRTEILLMTGFVPNITKIMIEINDIRYNVYLDVADNIILIRPVQSCDSNIPANLKIV